MFQIGDNIFYPMQGIGVIDRIDNNEFYIIKILNSTLEIMIPIDRSSNLRLLTPSPDLDDILSNIQHLNTVEDEITHPKQRYRVNMDKIRDGSFKTTAEVVYDLTKMNQQKPLNSSEKQMLTNARKIMIEEICLIKNISEDDANELLDKSID